MTRCPICKRPVPEPENVSRDNRQGNLDKLDKPGAGQAEASQYYPFCSDRCRLIDLGRWLDGRYQIPAEDESATDE